MTYYMSQAVKFSEIQYLQKMSRAFPTIALMAPPHKPKLWHFLTSDCFIR